ncbi:MAG: hypothetical protein R3F33_07840 [Planctomycetota bacterium]
MALNSHEETILRGMANKVLDLSGTDGTGHPRPVVYHCTYEEWVERTGHEAPGVR